MHPKYIFEYHPVLETSSLLFPGVVCLDSSLSESKGILVGTINGRNENGIGYSHHVEHHFQRDYHSWLSKNAFVRWVVFVSLSVLMLSKIFLMTDTKLWLLSSRDRQ